MSRIFISYRRDDSAGYVGRLYDRLSEHFGADQIFMDIDTIEPGVDFVDVIDKAVDASDVILVVIGKLWASITDSQGRRRLDNAHDFVRLEVASALKRNARVIPILVRDAAMPNADELPLDLEPLLRRNAIEIDDKNFHYDVNRLIETLERVLGVPKSRAAKPVTPQSRTMPQPYTRPLYPEPSASVTLSWGNIVGYVIRAAFIWGIMGGIFAAFVNTVSGDDVFSSPMAVPAYWVACGLAVGLVYRRPHHVFPSERLTPGWIITSCLVGVLLPVVKLRRVRPPIGWIGVLIVLGSLGLGTVGGFLLPSFVISTLELERTRSITTVNFVGFTLWAGTIGFVHSVVTFFVLKWSGR